MSDSRPGQAAPQLRLPQRQYDQLQAFARSRGMTFSRLVREALALFLRSELAKGLPK